MIRRYFLKQVRLGRSKAGESDDTVPLWCATLESAFRIIYGGQSMHIQIINFNLDGISRSEYEQVCDDLAQTFADVPGLISKHWLANDDTNTFGGVYMFESKDAYEAFIGSELFAAVGGNPALANISSKDFGVIEGPTRITRGM